MLFPDTNRFIYRKNPLTEVVCQFRYPTILRIEDAKPVEFQEAIRNEYPIFNDKTILNPGLPQDFVNMLPPEFINGFGKGYRAYEFTTKDHNWTVSLTQDFLALTTKNYTRWEEFYEKLRLPLDALNEIYVPSFFSRIGLRYQDVIKRSNISLQDVSWSKLINPILAGFLGDIHLESAVNTDTKATVLNLEDNLGKVRIRHGTVKNDEEVCYLIDSDFFTEDEKDIKYGSDIIREFNRRNRNLFRWCITDKLHKAMEPEQL